VKCGVAVVVCGGVMLGVEGEFGLEEVLHCGNQVYYYNWEPTHSRGNR
jgi:hypothetical protein